MAVSLLVLLLIIVIGASLRGGGRRAAQEGLGTAVRRFFQYGVQFGLVVIVAVGLSILLGRALQWNLLVAGGRDELAQGLSFTLVGVPLLWFMVRWTRRRMAADPREVQSLPWQWYLALAELVPLAIASMSLQTVLLWLVRVEAYDGGAVASAVVWSAAWAVHLRVTRRSTPAGEVRDHEFAGAAFGLWSAASGLASFLGSSLESMLTVRGKDLLVQGGNPVLRAGVSLLVGVAIWSVYWLRNTHRSPRTLHWHVYVLIVGVGAGLVTAIVSASVVLYDVLVWFFGTPDTTDASIHFRGSMTAIGACAAGALVWWYHRSVLRETGAAVRDEAQRVYEYVVSLIALVAAAVGVMILLVALLESVTASASLAGAGAGNTLLLAATLLLVGTPIWWRFWRGIERAVAQAPAQEAASPARRVYLFVLFGVVGVAALVSLLVAVYLLFTDVVAGTLGTGTLRSMRWGISILITAAVVASYHWQVYRSERDTAPEARRRTLILVGTPDPDLARELHGRLGARVQQWERLDGDTTVWTADAVEAVLQAVDHDEVLVIAQDGALRAIPVERG